MSITTALANAYSGLVASSRTAELVSNNVANAMTAGYARREVALSAASIAGVGIGVKVDGVIRAADTRTTYDRRRAEAGSGEADVFATASARIAALVGEPGAEGSLSARATAFANALAAAGDTPESTPMQADLLRAAKDYSVTLNKISAENRRVRMEADSSIAGQVQKLNSSLQAIQQINREIQIRSQTGGETAALEDQRAQLIDQVNSIIPIRAARRDGGQIALYSTGGAALLDGKAFEFGFTATPSITADMSLGSGALSGLTLNGNAVSIGTGSGLVEGGTLSASFAVRDVTAPAIDGQIDALAADLISRFEGTAVDPTLAATDPGLFTDAGSQLDTASTAGLAGRIAINDAVNPETGGELWRLRDGINAATPGLAGDDTLFRAMEDALEAALPADAATGLTGDFGGTGLADELSALILLTADTDEAAASYAAGQAEVMQDAELALTGVDTDQEMQKLLLVENSYAANARVIQAVDAMLQTLLEI